MGSAFEISAVSGGGITQDQLTTASGNIVSQIPAHAGKILQVVSTTKTDTFSSNSTSFTDITGLSVSITPSSSSSKVHIVVTGLISGNSMCAMLQLVRGSTPISIGDAASNRTRATISNYQAGANYGSNTFAITYLDSPASTSSLTYKVQGLSDNAGTSFYINRTAYDEDATNRSRGVATITVMEIGA